MSELNNNKAPNTYVIGLLSQPIVGTSSHSS